jgi:hypothetical protein
MVRICATTRTDKCILGFHSTRSLFDDTRSAAFDWIDNIQQFCGIEAELYQQVKEVAQRIRPEFSNDVIFTGHSLGGGLAIVAALVSGGQAIVFNPPKIHRNTIAGLRQDGSRIARYRVEGDIVSKIHWSGDHIELGQETSLPMAQLGILPHSLKQVLSSLQEGLWLRAFLIDTIIEILQPRVALPPNQLRQLVFDIVQGKALPPNTLPDLLAIEYEIEKVSEGSAKITTSVLYRKNQESAEKIKQETGLAWSDLPDEFRSEFIKTRKTLLTYSLYTRVK